MINFVIILKLVFSTQYQNKKACINLYSLDFKTQKTNVSSFYKKSLKKVTKTFFMWFKKIIISINKKLGEQPTIVF